MIKEPSFFILVALARAPLHGYGIVQAVDRLSDGRITLRAGTLYAALDRLTGEGLLAPNGEEIVDGRLRKHYRITDEGLKTLKDSADRFAAHARLARAQLAGVRHTGVTHS